MGLYRREAFALIFVLLAWAVAVNEAELTKEHEDVLGKIASMLAEREKTTTEKAPASKIPVPIIKDETEVEKAERMQKGFERMIGFVNILGQVDNFITDRTKSVIRKLNAMYDIDEKERSKRSA